MQQASFLYVLVDAWLPRAAVTKPQQLAVNNLTYGQLLLAVQRAARQLSALGVVRGDRVAVVLAPGEQFAVVFHATLLLGAVAVPASPDLPADQLADRTDRARVVVDRPLDGHEDPAVKLDTHHDLSATAVIIFSSGSSGAAKEVALSYGNFWWSAAGSAVALGLDREERWLCCLPLTHVGGLSILIRSAIYATEALIHERFDQAAILAELSHENGPTLISLVPTTLQRLLDAGLSGPPSLRWVLLGGGPISAELIARAASASVPLASSYGMTEACSQIYTGGAPLFCTSVELDRAGEILISGPTVANQCQPQLRTGDVGRWDELGGLNVVGRISALIITGGENVAPEAVEAVLAAHPAVADVAVVGREDREWGEKVTAIVQLEPGVVATDSELIDFAAPLLSPHERPKQVEFVDTLPRSENGKLLRSEL